MRLDVRTAFLPHQCILLRLQPGKWWWLCWRWLVGGPTTAADGASIPARVAGMSAQTSPRHTAYWPGGQMGGQPCPGGRPFQRRRSSHPHHIRRGTERVSPPLDRPCLHTCDRLEARMGSNLGSQRRGYWQVDSRRRFLFPHGIQRVRIIP